ncbi:ribonuclease H-like domain-containing protein [Tanacetum coccineum]
MALIRDNNRSGLVKPEIGNDVDFEIKSQIMKELRRNLFAGTDDEDAHKHMRRALEIADLFHIPGVTHSAVMLRVFPITLTGAARRWKNMLLVGSITTWDLLEKIFTWKYCPPFKTTRKLDEIQNFKQGWTRRCIKLRKGLYIPSRKMLNSQGLIPMIPPAQALKSIQVMTDHLHNWYDGASTWQGSNDSSDVIGVVTNRLDSLEYDAENQLTSKPQMMNGLGKFIENTDLNLEKLDAVTKNLEVKVEKLTQAVLTNEGNTVVKVNANMEKAREVKKELVPRDLPIFNPYVLPIPFPGHLKEQEDDPYITYESVCIIGFSKRTHEEDLKLLIAKYT